MMDAIDWLTQMGRRLWMLLRRGQFDSDLEEEMRLHRELREQGEIERGLSAKEAHYAAQRRFGNPLVLREESRDMWGWNWLENLLQDIRYGLRQLRRSPGFTAVAVITLALGIGANTAIFSLVNAVLLKTLPVRNPQQLVLLNWTSHAWPATVHKVEGDLSKDKTGRFTAASFSYPIYQQIRERQQVFSSVTALAADDSQLNVGYKGTPGRASGELVSGTFFSTLGVQPLLGRALTPDDDRTGASPAAVISYGYWQQRFGGDADTVGRSITVNSAPFTVVGVAPPEFYGVRPGRAIDVWLPLHAEPQAEPSGNVSWSGPQPRRQSSPFEARDDWWVLVMGRLKPEVSNHQARMQLDVLLQQGIAVGVKPGTKPETIPHLGTQTASKGLNDLREEFSQPLFILMTVVGLVLLIACANLANLSLARGTSRQKEVAVRLAVGAGRGRLIRQLLTESMLLAGLGGALGLLLAFFVADLLVAFIGGGRDSFALSATPDVRVLGFTALAATSTGILFGLAPALRLTRLDLTPALKESTGYRLAGARSRRAARLGLGKGLVVTQVSLSLLLLVGAGLLVRTLTNLRSVNLGFDARNLLLFGIDPTQDGYKGQRLADFYLELTRRLKALPGVRSVSFSELGLIGTGQSNSVVSVLGYTPQPGQKGARVCVNLVGPGFFETVGIPLVLGRAPGEADHAGAPIVAVVNERFARDFLRGGNPIGRRFGFGEEHQGDVEIVGIVGDARYNEIRNEAPPTVYLPAIQNPDLGGLWFELRTAGNPMALANAVRLAAQSMDQNLALYGVRSEVEQIKVTLSQERLFAWLTSLFGVLAALLACMGIYGVMAFAVTRRTHEVGIRMALGASRRQITALVLRETFVLVGIGAALGIVGALGASRLISSLLYGLRPNDPFTIAGAALLMLAVAGLAGYLPARRASKVDPLEALRFE